MKNKTYLILFILVIVVMSCNSQLEGGTQVEDEGGNNTVVELKPKEMLSEAYQLFQEGDDEGSIKLANQVLEMGRSTNNDTLIGGALTSLCRNAQRSLDTLRLAELSDELVELSASTGNQKWLMYRAHMNAEMWRLIGNMDRAEAFYNESMKISHKIGSMGMYTIDHFNKSFVSTAKGDYETANDLIKKYYQLREEQGQSPDDAYGLIALAYLLEQQEKYKGAHEVSVVTRRLFKEQNLFPEPPDEKPLLAVEQKVLEVLSQETREKISADSKSKSVSDLLETYLR